MIVLNKLVCSSPFRKAHRNLGQTVALLPFLGNYVQPGLTLLMKVFVQIDFELDLQDLCLFELLKKHCLKIGIPMLPKPKDLKNVFS